MWQSIINLLLHSSSPLDIDGKIGKFYNKFALKLMFLIFATKPGMKAEYE